MRNREKNFCFSKISAFASNKCETRLELEVAAVDPLVSCSKLDETHIHTHTHTHTHPHTHTHTHTQTHVHTHIHTHTHTHTHAHTGTNVWW